MLYNVDGNVLVDFNLMGLFYLLIGVFLLGGIYYFVIMGVGEGVVLGMGYMNYGSFGCYNICGVGVFVLFWLVVVVDVVDLLGVVIMGVWSVLIYYFGYYGKNYFVDVMMGICSGKKVWFMFVLLLSMVYDVYV